MRLVARSLLENKAFDIEFNGYLTNHAKHAVIALERLQAPESRVQEYWDKYTSMTPYSLPLQKVEFQDWEKVTPATPQQWTEWRGKKVNWQEQVVFMNHELQRFKSDPKTLVQHYAPDLWPGMAGSLTHGIIHLGWAIDAGSPFMITEGLAYLNFCYLALDESRLVHHVHSETSPMDSYLRVARIFDQEQLQVKWIDHVVKGACDETFHPELVPAGFQWQLAKTLHKPHAVATELPTWLNELSLEEIWEGLYRAITCIFLATRSEEGHGNFLVLHLITSLWALEQTIRYAELSEEKERKALANYYAMSVVLVSTGGSGFPEEEVLTRVREDYPAELVDSPELLDWESTIQAAIAETEEHNPKLVYVAKTLWERYGHWKGFSLAAKAFTLTPNIGPSPFVS